MSLSEQIHADMVSAMRNKETIRLGTLRMVKAALTNKQVETGNALSDDAAIGVLNTLVKQRRDSAEQFRKGQREAMALREEEEIGVIETYLPAPATDEEILAAIAAAVDETGAASPRDMGRVMKATLMRLAGKTVNGGDVSRIVKERLSA